MKQEGRWITVRGARVFIADGQSIGDALKNRAKKTIKPTNKEKLENEKKIKYYFSKAKEMDRKGEFHKSYENERNAFLHIDENRMIAAQEKPGRYHGKEIENNPYYQQQKYAKGKHLTDPAVQKDKQLFKDQAEDVKQAIRMGMKLDKNRGKLRSPLFANDKKKITKK